jgi:hypothetical protein
MSRWGHNMYVVGFYAGICVAMPVIQTCTLRCLCVYMYVCM